VARRSEPLRSTSTLDRGAAGHLASAVGDE
jgi:hypothetical protein